MTAKKKRATPTTDAERPDAFDFAALERRLQAIRELRGAEVFRVFADTSDPNQVGEYVVQVDLSGLTIRESHEEAPGADHAHQLDWHTVHYLAGGAADHLREIERDTQSVIHELEAWEAIRDGEAHRILRARELQRTARIRQLCERAAGVLGIWERPRVAPKTASTWRDLTTRRNGRPRR